MRTSKIFLRQKSNILAFWNQADARPPRWTGATQTKSECRHAPLLGGRRLRLVHYVFLKLFHFRIGAKGLSHGRGSQLVHFRCREGFRVSLWIVNRNGEFQSVVVQPAETLDDVERVAMRMPRLIQPGLVVKADRVDDKSVPLVLSNR